MINILALGDGNFSFSLAIVKQLYESSNNENQAARKYLGLPDSINSSDIKLICTSFDSREEVIEKYPESDQILKKLQKFDNVTVMHQINAWELDFHFKKEYPRGFDVIYWNHPHLGLEDFRLHRFLMAHFLDSAMKSLNYQQKKFNPCVIITLVQGQESRWGLISQNSTPKRLGLLITDIIPCIEQDYEGYIVKRNKNGQSFKNNHTLKHTKSEMKSFTYRFVPQTLLNQQPDVEQLIKQFEKAELKGDVSNLTQNNANKVEDKTLIQEMLFDPVKYARKRTKQRKADKIDHTSNQYNWKCPECNKLQKTLHGIKVHYHAVHVLKKYGEFDQHPKFQCEHENCSKVFTKKEDLEQHVVYKHQVLSQNEQSLIHKDDYNESSVLENGDYQYKPCEICGQAVRISGNSINGLNYGDYIHLESLKPIIGMKMTCPLSIKGSESTDDGFVCSSNKKFMDTRALEQHFRQCRNKKLQFQTQYPLN